LFGIERMILLLNVGVPISAIQLIVCIFPIDTIDEWESRPWMLSLGSGDVVAELVRSTTRRCNLRAQREVPAGHDADIGHGARITHTPIGGSQSAPWTLQGGADIDRKIGRDQEKALCRFLLRFGIFTGRAKF
jgi:hypothetical protein